MESAESIAQKLDGLFPTGGQTEDIGSIKAQCDALALQIHEVWHELPETLQNRIRGIEQEVCKRVPLALHIEPWFKDGDDLDEIVEALHEVRQGGLE